MSPGSLSTQPRKDSLTRGILIVVATWSGVLMLLKDRFPWPVIGRSGLPDNLVIIGAALFGAGALGVAVLAVSLTLTRLADWFFYRRRWTLPLLIVVVVGLSTTWFVKTAVLDSRINGVAEVSLSLLFSHWRWPHSHSPHCWSWASPVIDWPHENNRRPTPAKHLLKRRKLPLRNLLKTGSRDYIESTSHPRSALKPQTDGTPILSLSLVQISGVGQV